MSTWPGRTAGSSIGEGHSSCASLRRAWGGGRRSGRGCRAAAGGAAGEGAWGGGRRSGRGCRAAGGAAGEGAGRREAHEARGGGRAWGAGDARRAAITARDGPSWVTVANHGPSW
eukprot:439051-Prymnesium_polylepis.1